MKKYNGIALVTGSSGTIGSAVMQRVAGRFDSIVGFDHEAPKPPPPDCAHVAVEFTSDESVEEGLRTLREHHGAHVATVIHLAAYYDFFGEPSTKYDETTVRGSGRLLRGLRDQAFQVQQFRFSTTLIAHRPP